MHIKLFSEFRRVHQKPQELLGKLNDCVFRATENLHSNGSLGVQWSIRLDRSETTLTKKNKTESFQKCRQYAPWENRNPIDFYQDVLSR